ncbi:hypothetical protein KC363_g133 [Hortaea werneckii]|nr:hypothetical protein KC363_g133 [Hortaea werneckii]
MRSYSVCSARGSPSTMQRGRFRSRGLETLRHIVCCAVVHAEILPERVEEQQSSKSFPESLLHDRPGRGRRLIVEGKRTAFVPTPLLSSNPAAVLHVYRSWELMCPTLTFLCALPSSHGKPQWAAWRHSPRANLRGAHLLGVASSVADDDLKDDGSKTLFGLRVDFFGGSFTSRLGAHSLCSTEVMRLSKLMLANVLSCPYLALGVANMSTTVIITNQSLDALCKYDCLSLGISLHKKTPTPLFQNAGPVNPSIAVPAYCAMLKRPIHTPRTLKRIRHRHPRHRQAHSTHLSDDEHYALIAAC